MMSAFCELSSIYIRLISIFFYYNKKKLLFFGKRNDALCKGYEREFGLLSEKPF